MRYRKPGRQQHAGAPGFHVRNRYSQGPALRLVQPLCEQLVIDPVLFGLLQGHPFHDLCVQLAANGICPAGKTQEFDYGVMTGYGYGSILGDKVLGQFEGLNGAHGIVRLPWQGDARQQIGADKSERPIGIPPYPRGLDA